jgi:hypothetical protein
LKYDERIVWDGEPPPKRKPGSNPRLDATLEALERGTMKGKTFAANTVHWGERGLAIFNRMPSTAWWVRAYDLLPVLIEFELRALDGIVACGAGAPSETVPVARHIDSPRVAPMMAEAFARLAKQRAIAETWLMTYPRAAAIGLVPNVAARGKAREYAEKALQHLVSAGHGALVRDVAREYGLEDQLEAVLSAAPREAPVTASARADLDEEVRDLERRLLRANASSAAYALLDRLTAIDTDRAVFAVAEVASRGRSRPIRRRAAQSLEAVRARRTLSASDLAERMIPRLGLDDPATAFVEVAARRYRLVVSSDFTPELIDEAGTRTARLPRGASDDVKRRYKLLAKELTTVGKAMRARLELRSITGEAWSAGAFREHVLAHPVLREIARGLLFRTSGGTCFRVAEDYTLADVEDSTFSLRDDEQVTVAHPLDVDAGELARWVELFADYELLQSFEQLARAHHRVEVEAGRAPALEGREVSAGAILGLERRGYRRAHIDHGPTLLAMERQLAGLHAVIDVRPGIVLTDVANAPRQTISRVAILGAPTPRALSEIARDVLQLR